MTVSEVSQKESLPWGIPASTAAASGRPRFRSGLRYVVNDLAIVFCRRVCRRSVFRQLSGRIVGVNREAIVLAGQDDLPLSELTAVKFVHPSKCSRCARLI